MSSVFSHASVTCVINEYSAEEYTQSYCTSDHDKIHYVHSKALRLYLISSIGKLIQSLHTVRLSMVLYLVSP